ncbi:MAG TPA: organomercurial lyase [Acidimicrobiia bacterium]|nr:organomercurial lyase [Acidimicrobiia bacterium]
MSGAPDLGAGAAAVPGAAADPALEGAVRRAGFAALLEGRYPTLQELAVAAGVADEAAESVVTALVGAGRATVTPDGRLDGIAGVTGRPTRHAIESPGRRPVRTWCGFDAVAIPAALGWAATAVTTCGGCGSGLRIEIEDGAPAGDGWGWLPPADCEHVLRDFCAAADLFCSREHLDRWRAAAGDPPGEARSVADLAELGRAAWADCLPPVNP